MEGRKAGSSGSNRFAGASKRMSLLRPLRRQKDRRQREKGGAGVEEAKGETGSLVSPLRALTDADCEYCDPSRCGLCL